MAGGLRASVQVKDGQLVVAVKSARGLPKTQTCAKCDQPATKRVLWAEKMAYQPACDKHLATVKAELAAKNGGSVDEVRDIPAAGEVESKAGIKPVHEARPYDSMGKVVEVGGTVALAVGGQGTVTEHVGGGRVRVRRDDGREVVIDAGETTLIRGADANAQRATGPDGLQAALEEDPDATPPPGDRDDAEAELSADAAVDRPVGAEPAPDAVPDGADAVFSTPTGDQLAWLRTDEGDLPVGYFRPEAGDPSTTIRFTDTQAWAESVDGIGMVDATGGLAEGPTAPTVAGFQTDPNLPPTTPPEQPAPVEPSDLPAAAGAPTRVDRGPGTMTPETLSRFLLAGLDQVPDAVAQAKAEAIAGIAARMTDVDDDVVLRHEDLERLGRLEGEQVTLLRIPKPGIDPSPAPTVGEQLTQWVYREIATDRFQALLAAGTPPPANLEVVTADQWRTWARSARIAGALALWASGAGGTNPDALALQEAAADLFGMEGYAPPAAFEAFPELRQQVEDVLTADRPFYDALLLAMYQATQERFRNEQVLEVELFRGWRTPDGTPEWAVEAITEELPVRPLSSWSAEPHLAGGYARGDGTQLGYVLNTVVPAERILSTPRTGFGALQVMEFVVLAGPGPIALHEATEADGVALPTTWTPPVEQDDPTEEGDDPRDPTLLPAGLIGTEDDLTAALAAADEPGRRMDLMRRAQTMGLGRLIPEDWQADGTSLPVDGSAGAQLGPDGRVVPLDEDALAVHTSAVEDAIARAKAAGLETTLTHSLDGNGEVWPEDRVAAHVEIVDAVWATAANVPDEGKALLIGGLPGARAGAVLATPRAGIDPSQYLTVKLDDVKEIMVARDLVPDVPDAGVELSPLERVPLIHDEAVHVATLVAARAYADRKNVAWDLGLADGGTVEAFTGRLRAAGYGEVVGVFIDLPIELAVERTAAAYRAGFEDYRNDEGLGGRYVPAATLRALSSSQFTSAPRVHFEDARDGFDDWQVWNDAVDGRDPELVYYRDAPNLEQLTESARTGQVPQTKTMPGTRAALAAVLRRERLLPAGGWIR